MSDANKNSLEVDLDDSQLMRYARHVLLDELGIAGQQKLLQSKVLILGAGGLGSPAAFYLAAAGVGSLIIADDDVVELSNLQRQILHNMHTLGDAKSDSAKQSLHAINPDIKIISLVKRLDEAAFKELCEQVDLVLDCSDNFSTRYAINRACVATSTPLVSGAAIKFSGQVSVYDFRRADSPCYHCLFPEMDDATELRCATTGVLGPLVGIVGSTQAAEAIKLITGMGQTMVGRLLSIDALNMNFHTIRFKRDPQCVVCSQRDRNLD